MRKNWAVVYVSCFPNLDTVYSPSLSATLVNLLVTVTNPHSPTQD